MQYSLIKTKSNNITMSLTQLNQQIVKSNSKLFVEFTRNFGEDLLNDLMLVLRQQHEEAVERKSDLEPEEAFDQMRERFNDVLENRIEQMEGACPKSVRGRKPKATIQSVVAVEDSEDESIEKRGRPKKPEAILEPIVLTKAESVVLERAEKKASTKVNANKKSKSLKHGVVKGDKIYRRLTQTIIKKNGSTKKAKVWRSDGYVLKPEKDQKWLDEWAISDKTPNANAQILNTKPSLGDVKVAAVEDDVKIAAVVEEVKVAAVEDDVKIATVVEEVKVAAVEDDVKIAPVVEEVVIEIIEKVTETPELEDEELKAEEFDDEVDENESNFEIETNFTPNEPFLPFTGCEERSDLVTFTDKESENYGKIISKTTLELFGWVDQEDDEQYVNEKPDYDFDDDDDSSVEVGW
jgi:hypothetical protein